MKIGFVSPSRKIDFIQRLGITEEFYEESLKRVAEYLARKHKLIVTPDKGSVSEQMALEYIKYGGEKVIGIIPQDDTEFGIKHLNLEMCEEIINCGRWIDQPARFDKESDVLLVFGLSPGVFIELSYTKWYEVDNIFVLKEFLDEKLPVSLERNLNITYIILDELDKI